MPTTRELRTRKLLWATDVHLDHLRHPAAAQQFGLALADEHPEAEALLVSGDIGEGPSVVRILTELAHGFGGLLCFVLGNHDYYGATFATVDAAVAQLCQGASQLVWLQQQQYVWSPSTLLVGCNGWYDARYGDRNSDLQLTDFTRIGELFAAQELSREALLQACAARADRDAAVLDERLAAIAPDVRQVLVAMHVPPFQAAAWHEGKQSDDRWAPFFSSRALGQVLERHATARPEVRFVVLCGHTHGGGVFEARANLVVYTGRARYGAPELAGVIELDEDGIRVLPFGS